MDIDALVGSDQALSIAVNAILFYTYMVILLRISGKRTTMEMTSFDFVSTVAMATIIGSTILQEAISLLEGIVAVTVLVALQWVAGFFSARSSWFRHVITSSPAILYKDGRFHEQNLSASRISREQLLQKVRAAGHAGTDSVSAIVLESAGKVSVVAKSKSAGDLEITP
jgi:uncharacterized membrane protein YcaP (DUF421 family)